MDKTARHIKSDHDPDHRAPHESHGSYLLARAVDRDYLSPRMHWRRSVALKPM
jgi:hypothetical protein